MRAKTVVLIIRMASLALAVAMLSSLSIAAGHPLAGANPSSALTDAPSEPIPLSSGHGMSVGVSSTPIDFTLFGDLIFLSFVYERIGKQFPDAIYQSDLEDITTLNIQNLGIGRIGALEYFTNLEILNCSGNNLVTLPNLPASLLTLDCSNNQLTSLPDLPTSLSMLNCSNNRLTGLNVTGLSLTFLDCTYNYMVDPSEVIGFPVDRWDNVRFSFHPQHTMHTITVTAGEGGIVSPSGIVRVVDGRNLVLTISADAGYRISSVEVVFAPYGPNEKEDGPGAPEVTGSYTGDGTVFTYTVDYIPGAEYRMDNGEWQDSNVFTGIVPSVPAPSHTFYARIKETLTHNAGDVGSTGLVNFERLSVSTSPPLNHSVTGDFPAKTVTIIAVPGAEYSFNGVIFDQTNTHTSSEAEELNLFIRWAETLTHLASYPPNKLTINTANPANYGAVNAAIVAAEAIDRDLYTTESLAALDAAIAAVIRDLPATDQEIVDGFAAAINAAYDALVEWQPVTTFRLNLNTMTRVARNSYLDLADVITVNEHTKFDIADVTFTVSNTAIATISDDGTRVNTLNRAGAVTLIATYTEGEGKPNFRSSVTLMIT